MSDLNDAGPLDGRDKLEPCPRCGSTDHLHVSKCGSLTGDMPDRPYRVVCDHIDHDQVQGPVEYGRYNAIAAWNRRALSSRPDAGEAVGQRLKYESDVIDAVQRLIEQGRATVDSEGYLVAHPPAAVGGEGITQRDRDDCADLWLMIGRCNEYDAENIRRGDWDGTKDLKWFADRRAALAQPAAPQPSETQRVVEWLRQTPWALVEQNEIADAIQRGDHLKGGRDG